MMIRIVINKSGHTRPQHSQYETKLKFDFALESLTFNWQSLANVSKEICERLNSTAPGRRSAPSRGRHAEHEAPREAEAGRRGLGAGRPHDAQGAEDRSSFGRFGRSRLSRPPCHNSNKGDLSFGCRLTHRLKVVYTV